MHAQSETAFHEEYDVVVVGSGAAGAAAALEAHGHGARVLVLEKADASTAGGNTRVSGGGWFVNADPQRARVFLRALSHGYPLPDEVVDTWAEETALNSDWLRGLGADVRPNADYHVGPEYAELEGSDCYTGMDTVAGKMGNFLLYDVLMSAMGERGIAVRYSSPATRLIRSGDQVVGVETGGDAQPRRIGARGGVVLATGGFEADARMVRDYLPVRDPLRWGSPHATGDGHRMAQAAGADLWHMNNMMTNVGVGEGEVGHLLSLWAAKSYVFVDVEGRRFIDESARNRHGHIARNGGFELFPLHPHYLVFDDSVFSGGAISPSPDVLPVGWATLMEKQPWSADNSQELEAGVLKKADTIAELAGEIGMDPGVLERTIAAYNEACATGSDDVFARHPATLSPIVSAPFYATLCRPLLGWTNGGPRRDGRSRVLDPEGVPIAGLYAAGTVSSTYSWAKDGGFHIADALAFGRVAGRASAERSR